MPSVLPYAKLSLKFMLMSEPVVDADCKSQPLRPPRSLTVILVDEPITASAIPPFLERPSVKVASATSDDILFSAKTGHESKRHNAKAVEIILFISIFALRFIIL